MDALDLIKMTDFCRSRLLSAGIQDAFGVINTPLTGQELKKFIYSAIKKDVGIDDSRKLIGKVAGILESENPEFKQETLEKLICSYQFAQKKLRIVWQECDEIRDGHGVVLYDKSRPDTCRHGQNIAYIEGYEFRHALARGARLPLKGYCIKPDAITTVDIIDEMKYRIEELMKLTIPGDFYFEIITDRIFADLNC